MEDEGALCSRRREALLNTPKILRSIRHRAVIEQGLARALIGTVGDAKLVANLIANGAKVGDAVDVEVGGLVDESVSAGAASGPDCRNQPGTLRECTPP
jgi:hypothetical protein